MTLCVKTDLVLKATCISGETLFLSPITIFPFTPPFPRPLFASVQPSHPVHNCLNEVLLKIYKVMWQIWRFIPMNLNVVLYLNDPTALN